MDLTTMRQACESTEAFVAAVTDDQHGRPTPCAEWNVRDLLNHLLATLVLGEALLGDKAPAIAAAPGELPDRDLVGDDALKAYRVGVEALLAAAGGDALTRPHATPLGEMPGEVLGGFTTLDIAVHGWDLARATGQDPTLDAGLAEAVLDFAHRFVTDRNRGARIGPPVPVDAGAPATDRLAAFLGRTP